MGGRRRASECVKERARAFLHRHDVEGIRRQATFALVLLGVDAFVAVVSKQTAHRQTWARDIPHARTERLYLYCVVLVLLLVACTEWLHWGARAIAACGVGTPYRDRGPYKIEMYRPYLFYIAVYWNLFCIADLIHISGGLTGSPYTSFLFATILSAQQLSRYRRQSGWYIAMGVVFVIGIIGADQVLKAPLPTVAPRSLTAAITVGGFAAAAFVVQLTKPVNPRSAKRMPLPKGAALYQDTHGSWRYTILTGYRTIDHVVPCMPGEDGNWDLAEVKRAVEGEVKRHHGWQGVSDTLVSCEWSQDAKGDWTMVVSVSVA